MGLPDDLYTYVEDHPGCTTAEALKGISVDSAVLNYGYRVRDKLVEAGRLTRTPEGWLFATGKAE